MGPQARWLLLSEVILILSFSALVGAERQYKGFRRFSQLYETHQRAVIEEQWFTQKLDHFDAADNRYWKQVSLFRSYNYC